MDKQRVNRLLIYVVLGIYAMIVAYPLLLMLVTAFKSTREIFFARLHCRSNGT